MCVQVVDETTTTGVLENSMIAEAFKDITLFILKETQASGEPTARQGDSLVKSWSWIQLRDLLWISTHCLVQRSGFPAPRWTQTLNPGRQRLVLSVF